jgi:hypothetical protein
MLDPQNNPLRSESLKETALNLIKAVALSLPIVSCGTPHDQPIKFDENLSSLLFKESITRKFLDGGASLQSIEFKNDQIIGSYGHSDQKGPFSILDLKILDALSSDKSELQFIALDTLRYRYRPHLSPAVLSIALNQPDSQNGLIASSLILRNPASNIFQSISLELHSASGSRLERAIELSWILPEDIAVNQLFSAIRSSGFGEKEGRDESMELGKTLVHWGNAGESRLKSLLLEEDASMKLAGAVSLASKRDPEALETILRFSMSDDFIIRSEALRALSYYPDEPAALISLTRGLLEKDFSQTSLSSLKSIGSPAIQVLLPLTDPSFFTSCGIERSGQNPFLPGLSYGEIIEAVMALRTNVQDKKSDEDSYERALNQISSDGLAKLLADLDQPQLCIGAKNGIQSLHHLAYPLIPHLISKNIARGILLSYPIEQLARSCSTPLGSPIITPAVIDVCVVLSQKIRIEEKTEDKQRSLSSLLNNFPDASWTRHLISEVWRESKDQRWIVPTIMAAPLTPAVCKIQDEIMSAERFNIDVPFRWSESVLAEFVRNRSLMNFDGRPIAVIVYTEFDHNGAFGIHSSQAQTLIDAGYCVMYYDESSESGVLQSLKNAVTRPLSEKIQPADLIILGAHSNQNEMNFGDGLSEETKIELSDETEILNSLVGGVLKDSGQIILTACSGGAKREKEPNIANMMRKIFPQARKEGIWSTEIPDNITSISLDPNTRELKDVNFSHSRLYRP